MKTKRTISNISYNSPDYFSNVIQSLHTARKIEWCYWILHQPDTDETKPHIHFVLQPSSAIDTFELRALFNEFDPSRPDKPLTCTSKWHYTNSLDDWLLYVVHDVGYLASKAQRRNITYDFKDIQTTDEDALRNDWNSLDRTRFDRLRYLAQAVKDGTPFAQLVQSGFIPIAQRAQYEFQYQDLLRLHQLDDSGRKESHEFDPETGEIIE